MAQFTYRCLECRHRLSASSRPAGCPRCDGRLRNESFERFGSTA